MTKSMQGNSRLKKRFIFLIPLFMSLHLFTAVDNAQSQAVDSDIEILKERFTADLLAGKINTNKIENLIRSIQNDGSWPHINYEDTSRTAFEHAQHLENLVELSRAYKKQGSDFNQDIRVKQTLDSALDFWLENDFICENWWWNQIGTPERMVHVLLIMDEELTEEQRAGAAPIVGRANLDAWGARPGGDLIKIAGILGEYGLFKRDTDIVEEAVEAIAGEIGFAADRGDPSDLRGLQTDFSFHHRHDRVTSTLSYGLGFAHAFADWAAKVAGTTFRFPDEALELLVDFYLEGISQTMIYGMYPDPGAKNRSITRKGTLNPQSPELPEKLLQATSYRRDELEEIVHIRKGRHQSDLTSNKFFWHSEYFSHQRPDYFTSVRMYSSRNHNMEVPYNSEGLKNHYYADGSNFISGTGKEYTNIFPAWDWQKIPGTTVVQRPTLPEVNEIQKRGLTDFVGGISDGVYGAAVFDFESPHDPLVARKSWFFFDEEFVCLGSGITSGSEHPVATTLNQSLLNGDVVVGVSNSHLIPDQGDHHIDDVSWVHHAEIAYLFPSPTDVHLGNKIAKGNWRSINRQAWATNDEVSEEVFTVWLDHGVAPEQAGYEYIVVPGIGVSEIEEYRKVSPVVILANTPEIQAVQHTELGITQIVFYEPGEIDISEGATLSVDTPGLIMVKMSGEDVQEITTSDPTRQGRSISVKLSGL